METHVHAPRRDGPAFLFVRDRRYTSGVAAIQDPKRLQLFGGKAKDIPGYGEKPRQDALGNKIPEPAEEIALIEKEIQELKIAFEQFFLGMERRAPVRRRDMLNERLRRFKQASGKMPTLLKHRLDYAHAKFTAFDRMWTRTISEIESGTYKRDLFKMKLRQKKGQATPEPTAPPPRPPEALSEGQIQALYDAFVMARVRTNEPIDGLTVQGLSQSLRKQVPQLIQKYNCKAIDFKVVIKDNRAVLKAVPRN
jgi:hypothetical protein